MDKLSYTLSPRNHDSDKVLLTICENSEGSEELIAQEEIQYEVRKSDGILQYQFANATRNTCSQNIHISSPSIHNSSGCQFYVINDLTANRPCLIAPKGITDSTVVTNRMVVGPINKRDEKRRATHKEVERRRRDKINQWIFKLKDLLPDAAEAKPRSSGVDSKGGILIKACEYIRTMQEQNNSFKLCLKDNGKLELENQKLREENDELRKDNQRLKTLLEDKSS